MPKKSSSLIILDFFFPGLTRVNIEIYKKNRRLEQKKQIFTPVFKCLRLS